MKITPADLVACHREIKLDELTHLEGNPHRADREALRRSLDQFGQFEPIAVWRGEILIGNHRVDEALHLEWETLAGYDFSQFDLSTAERLARAVASNQIASLGTDDDHELAAMLGQIDDEDLVSAAGFDDDLVAMMRRGDETPRFMPEDPEGQPRLDQKNAVVCPECSHTFHPD